MTAYATAIRALMGLGKTTLVVKAIGKAKGTVEYYAPTHALAEEVKALIKQVHPSLSVRVIAGRSHPGANGKPLCAKHKLAEDVARAGGEVFTSLCEKKRSKRVERCRYFATCPYIAQFRAADVTIYPHAYLPLERMRLEPSVPDNAIIDESFYQSCIAVIDVPFGLLRAPFLDVPAAAVCREIEHALVQGLPLYEHLAQVGIGQFDCIDAMRSLGKRASIAPAMKLTSQRAALPQLRERSLLRRLLGTVVMQYSAWAHGLIRVIAYGRPRTEGQGLIYNPARQMVRVHIKERIRRFDQRTFGAQGKSASVLIIDGSADERIINQWFPRADIRSISAPRNAWVIQCCSTRCSTTSLSPRRNTDPKSRKAARARLRQVEALVARVAKVHLKVLVVGPQEITGNPKQKIKPLIRVPTNVELAHFNAIRGIDKWKDCDAVIVIGRNEPPIEAVEGIARCVFAQSSAPLQFASDWQLQIRGYRLRKGKRGIEVPTHPDPRIQAVHEQLREGESLQAIDRLRLVHSPTMKLVIILSNIPLDIDVDELVSWDELMEGTRLERAWNALPGVMPLQPEWLARRFPRLWATAGAAKLDAFRAAKELQITNINTISKLKLFKHQYRPTRPLSGGRAQRAWGVFLSADPNPKNDQAALEILLGFPIELRPPKRSVPPPQVVAPASVTSAVSAESGSVSSAATVRFAATLT